MKKRAAPIIAVMIAVCTMACPALAAEASPSAAPTVLYPTEVLEYTAGDLDELRISKTYELSPLDDPAQIPTEDFERSGLHYTLLDIIKDSLCHSLRIGLFEAFLV